MMPDAIVARPRRIRYLHGVELPRVTDARSADARLFRRRVQVYVAEIGGEANLNEFDRVQITQLVTVEVQISAIRKRMLDGDTIASDELIRLSSESRRILNGLRAKTQKKPAPATSIAEAMARTGA